MIFGSINRNIVECKAATPSTDCSTETAVLIETLWNVKIYVHGKKIDEKTVLIETLWNVNSA